MRKLLVTVPCKPEVITRFRQEFSEKLDIVFANEDPQIIANGIMDAEVIIGEPSPKLLPLADIVIGALPKTVGTIGLLDSRRLHLMKEDALLVNVGRGTMIVTKDLEIALEEGRFYGVVLDVMDPEPLPQDSPLWTCDRVLLTPHISGIGFDHEPQTEADIWDICFENLHRYLAGDPLTHVVDIAAGY